MALLLNENLLNPSLPRLNVSVYPMANNYSIVQMEGMKLNHTKKALLVYHRLISLTWLVRLILLRKKDARVNKNLRLNYKPSREGRLSRYLLLGMEN